ncbi:hypothetical protein PAXRUDRAFT_173910, partial [Paxillus rubicundulus Ve08.2h10]
TLDGFSLDPLYLAVQFTGSTRSVVTPNHIPIQVSIHIPDELMGQISPTLECSNTQIRREHHAHPHASWVLLADQIQFHLVQETQVEHPVDECLWVRKFFWMAYVAAFPTFPQGDWLNWNPRISMEGDFISYWMAEFEAGETRPDSVRMVWEFIWEELRDLAAHLLPIPVVAEPLT